MNNLAKNPEDLARFFVERINAGNLEGLVALYEENAILSCGNGKIAQGKAQIREFFTKLLIYKPQFCAGIQATALINGAIALTSTKLINGDITVEIARQQADGSWLWVVDQPKIN